MSRRSPLHVRVRAEETFTIEVNQMVRLIGAPDFSFPGNLNEEGPYQCSPSLLQDGLYSSWLPIQNQMTQSSSSQPKAR